MIQIFLQSGYVTLETWGTRRDALKRLSDFPIQRELDQETSPERWWMVMVYSEKDSPLAAFLAPVTDRFPMIACQGTYLALASGADVVCLDVTTGNLHDIRIWLDILALAQAPERIFVIGDANVGTISLDSWSVQVKELPACAVDWKVAGRRLHVETEEGGIVDFD